ncbi:MAG: hypothetical protein WC444_01585 [Candidatus Paceibacterota bacterium]
MIILYHEGLKAKRVHSNSFLCVLGFVYVDEIRGKTILFKKVYE